jgi:hypothetical protein
MKSSQAVQLWMAVLCLTALAGTRAANVPVVNPSFEDDPVSGDFTDVNMDMMFNDGDSCNFQCSFTGWGYAANSGVRDPTDQEAPPPPDGDQVMWTFFNAGGLQNLEGLYGSDQIYTLKVEIGDRLDRGFAGGSIGLYAVNPDTQPPGPVLGNNPGITVRQVDFDNTVVLDYWRTLNATSRPYDLLGRNCGVIFADCIDWRIQIYMRTLGSTGTETLFDHVRVDAIRSPPGTALPAINVVGETVGNADTQAIVMRSGSPRGIGTILDYASGTTIGTLEFTDGLAPVAAVSILDLNDNNADDVALLGYDRESTSAEMGRPVVEVRDSKTGRRVKNLDFNRQHRPVALEILDDQNANLSQEAAVLAERIADGRPRILIRDLSTKQKLNNISLPKIFQALSLDTAADFSGNGRAEALVLARRLSDLKGFVLVWDTGDEGKIVHIPLPRDHVPVDHAFMTGPGGIAAVAVLSLRESDSKARLFVFDAVTGVKLYPTTVWNREPIAVTTLVSPGGESGIAVLTRRPGDNTPVVSLLDGDSGMLGRNIAYESGQTPLDLVLLADLPADPNEALEIGVLVDTGFDLELRIRDTETKQLIQTVSVP